MEARNERFCDKISLFSKVLLVLKLGYSIYLTCHRPISSLTTVFNLCAVQVRSLCILLILLLTNWFFYQSQRKSNRRKGAVIDHHNTLRFSERSVDRMQLLKAKRWGYIFSFTQQTTKAYLVPEVFTLPGFYSVSIGSSLPTFWDDLSATYWRVKQSRKDILECLTLEVRTDRSSRNVGIKLPVYAAQNPRRAKIPFTLLRKPEITLFQCQYFVRNFDLRKEC